MTLTTTAVLRPPAEQPYADELADAEQHANTVPRRCLPDADTIAVRYAAAADAGRGSGPRIADGKPERRAGRADRDQ